MGNLLEDLYLSKIISKSKGEYDLPIRLFSTMFAISGVESRTELIRLCKEGIQFNKQFYNWCYKNKSLDDLSPQSLLYLPKYIVKNMGHDFLSKSPFNMYGNGLDFLAKWVSLLALRKIKGVHICSNGESVAGSILINEDSYLLDTKSKRHIPFDENLGYKKFSKSSIISALLVDKSWKELDKDNLKAKYYCDVALLISPNYLDALFCRGIVNRNSNLEDSILDLEKAIDLKPTFWKAHLNVAKLYSQEGELTKAKDHLSKIWAYPSGKYKKLAAKELSKLNKK